METGKIKWFNAQRGYGFIERKNKRDIYIHRNQWRGEGTPQEGQLVIFEKGEHRGKTEAKNVRPQSHQPTNGEYRFLNPYNFVRFLNQPRLENDVLGNCPPPPHDRYVGLTGRITCEIEAITPLFISDSHGVEEATNSHKTYHFFEYDGKPAIPASSLRGMVRSVFEAVTNSCLGVFDKAHLKALEYRKDMDYARNVKAGIILSLPVGDKPGAIALCETAKIGRYYTEQKWINRNIDISHWQNGEQVWARVTGRKHKIRVWQLAKKREDIRETTNNSRTVKGYLKITGNSIETKNNEFLFFNPNRNKSVNFYISAVMEYNQVLRGQIEDKRIEDLWHQNKQLKANDLVWVEINKKTNEAIRVLRVRVPRVPYKKSVNDVIGSKFKHLHHCTTLESLCPACRTFGWVAPQKTEEQQAYAGRLRFTHGTTKDGDYTPFKNPIPLAILSSPKPTTSLFYLLKENQPNAYVHYDTLNAQLRGRKVYRHHGTQFRENEYKSRGNNNDQNRTVKGALQKGSKFSFTIDFENLSKVELGALLWALELNEGMHHRLGYAKPLGFGSVKLTVTRLEQMNPENRYETLTGLIDGWDDINGQKEDLKKLFQDRMTELYGEFTELSIIKDLETLLKDTAQYPIHYPRSSRDPNKDEKNFEWFLGNRDERKEPLPFASNDTEGFRIWNRKGKYTD